MTKEAAATVLSYCTVAMVNNGALTIMESQQEYGEDSAVAVTPAKSIWLNAARAKKLRDFLNEQFPTDEQKRLDAILRAIRDNYEPDESAASLIDWIESTCPWFKLEVSE